MPTDSSSNQDSTLLQPYAKEIKVLMEKLQSCLDNKINPSAALEAAEALLGSVQNFSTMLLAFLEFKRDGALKDMALDHVKNTAYFSGRADAFDELLETLSDLSE